MEVEREQPMSIVLDLPPQLAADLAAEAANQGLPLQEYVLRLLTAGRTAAAAPRTGADLVAYWDREGLIGTRPDISDSQAHARELRRQAEQRERP
jgi:hypothetical protein